MENDACHDASIEHDPPDASEINGLVTLPQPVDEPETCGHQIGGLREQ